MHMSWVLTKPTRLGSSVFKNPRGHPPSELKRLRSSLPMWDPLQLESFPFDQPMEGTNKPGNKIAEIVRLQWTLKKWKKAADSHKGSSDKKSNGILKGFISICMGEEMRRFVIRTAHLGHRAFLSSEGSRRGVWLPARGCAEDTPHGVLVESVREKD